MRAITLDEMQQVSGGWLFCRPATTCGTTTTSSAQLGQAFYNLHQSVETFITRSGLRTPVVTAFDYAVVHPLLWNPLSALLGRDVANVSHG